MFPVLDTNRDLRQIKEMRNAGVYFIVIAVPWEMIAPHEPQAKANHYQTLERLAARGGLSGSEMLAVLENREWRSIELADAHKQLHDKVVSWLNAKRT